MSPVDDPDLLAALDDLAEHLAWPDASVDVTARAVDELLAVPVPLPHPHPVNPTDAVDPTDSTDPTGPIDAAPSTPPAIEAHLSASPTRPASLRAPGRRTVVAGAASTPASTSAVAPSTASTPAASTSAVAAGSSASATATGSSVSLWRLRWVGVAAAAAAVVLAAAIVPAARTAVADLLGLGGIRITTAGDDGAPPPVGGRGRLALGRPVSLDEAERLSPGPLPRPAGLGPPSAAFAGRPAGGVTLVWAPDDALPAVLDHDVGLLVTAFPGRVQPPEPVIGKRTSDGGTVEPITVDGEPAYWVAGEPHEMAYLDEEGTVQEDTARLSGNTLMWARDGVTYRLESALALPDALRLAESVPDEPGQARAPRE